jgi:hypothetical protein
MQGPSCRDVRWLHREERLLGVVEDGGDGVEAIEATRVARVKKQLSEINLLFLFELMVN